MTTSQCLLFLFLMPCKSQPIFTICFLKTPETHMASHDTVFRIVLSSCKTLKCRSLLIKYADLVIFVQIMFCMKWKMVFLGFD
jgi:hypothetical protein